MSDLNMLLNTMLDELSTENLAKKLIVHDEAREGFSLKKFTVNNYKQFVAIITEYVRYHKTAVGCKVTVEEAFAIATNLLEQGEGGLKTAYYISKTGVDSGLKHVVDTLCDGLRKQSEDEYYQYVLQTYINPADFEQKKELARQYVERFEKFLPSGASPMAAEELAGTIERQLLLHIKSVAKFAANFRGMK